VNDQIGQAELLVMLAIIRMHPDAYGVSIFEELATKTGRETPLATIYATLDRLGKKGFVKSRQGPATAERGGRRKMFFEVTAKGRVAMSASFNAVDELRQGTDFAGAPI
jgi:DNA-binding PadR family transcriptional regulator